MDFYGYDENFDYYKVGDYIYLHQADEIYLFCPNTNTNTHTNSHTTAPTTTYSYDTTPTTSPSRYEYGNYNDGTLRQL